MIQPKIKMTEIYLDATGIPVGRLASYAAKKALLGDNITILNCEHAIITGSKEVVFKRYHQRIRDIGQPTKGPFIPRLPDRFVRRIVRGMLDHKRPRGKQAFKRVMCYMGVPKEYSDKLLQKQPVKESGAPRFVYIKDLCKALGARI